MCVGYPELCPSAECREPLDVSKENVFLMLEEVFGELVQAQTHTERERDGGRGKRESVGVRGARTQGGRGGHTHKQTPIFPDAFVHLGGDEVNTDCWSSTPHIVEWMDTQAQAQQVCVYLCVSVWF
jgi:hexosaminidase